MKGRWSVALALFAAVLLIATAIWAAEGKAPAAKGPDGKELFTTYKCTSCHSVESEKIEKKSVAAEGGVKAAEPAAKKVPDLSGVGDKKDAAWISKYLMKEEKLNDKLHKSTKFKGTPEELKTLSAWLGSLKTKEGAKE